MALYDDLRRDLEVVIAEVDDVKRGAMRFEDLKTHVELLNKRIYEAASE